MDASNIDDHDLLFNCPMCNATGLTITTSTWTGAKSTAVAVCELCNGEKHFDKEACTCTRCDGTGWMKVHDSAGVTAKCDACTAGFGTTGSRTARYQECVY